MSCKTDLQVEHSKRVKVTEREQHRYQICHQAMLNAETVLARSTEALQIAEAEDQSLNEIITQLQD